MVWIAFSFVLLHVLASSLPHNKRTKKINITLKNLNEWILTFFLGLANLLEASVNYFISPKCFTVILLLFFVLYYYLVYFTTFFFPLTFFYLLTNSTCIGQIILFFFSPHTTRMCEQCVKTGRSRKYLGEDNFYSEIQESELLWNLLLKKVKLLYFTSLNFTLKITIISSGV